MSRTGAQLAILTLLVGLFVMRESRLAPVDALEEGFADFLAMNSRRTEAPAAVTLVGINDASLRDHPWPWSPLDFALFFQSASNFGPDIVGHRCGARLGFARDESRYPNANIRNTRRSCASICFVRRKCCSGRSLAFPRKATNRVRHRPCRCCATSKGIFLQCRDFPAIEAQPAEDYRLSSVTGFTNLPGASNWHRAVPLIFRYRGQIVPSFVLQAALLWEKLTLDEVTVELGTRVALG